MPVSTSSGWWGLGDHQGPHHTSAKESALDEDDLDHVSIDDETDGGLALTEELGADIGPL